MGVVSRDILLSGMDMQAKAKEAMASWVASLGQWKLFVTLTMTPPGSRTGSVGGYDRRGYAAAKHAWVRMVGYVTDLVGKAPTHFYVIEEHQSGVPHLHGLVGPGRGDSLLWDDRDLSELAKELERLCTAGIGWSRIRALGEGGAVAYVCKYCVKGDTIWDYKE